MKATMQRCRSAQVSVNGEVISKIGQGACIFIGISSKDNVKDIKFMVQKLLSVKLFDDENGRKWRKNVMENEFELLCISQFTLYNAWKANKPDFYNPMPSENSRPFYEKFIQMLKDKYNPVKIKDGVFSVQMQLAMKMDGPVTYIRTRNALTFQKIPEMVNQCH